jgi:hypothetical protein
MNSPKQDILDCANNQKIYRENWDTVPTIPLRTAKGRLRYAGTARVHPHNRDVIASLFGGAISSATFPKTVMAEKNLYSRFVVFYTNEGPNICYITEETRAALTADDLLDIHAAAVESMSPETQVREPQNK